MRPGVLQACEVTGKKVFPSELERCTVTGKRVLRQFLVSSSLSQARILQDVAIRSSTGTFCGLLSGEPTAAAPLISPDGGNFSSSQGVTLSSTTASAEIHYTLNGATPTSSSTLYNGPITIATNTTVNAIASATGYIQSGVSSATFTFETNGSCSAPTSAGVHICSPAAGSTVNSPVQVEASSTVTGTIAHMQLWVDGVKNFNASGSNTLTTSVGLAAGTHRFAVIATNTSGQKWESFVNATVQ